MSATEATGGSELRHEISIGHGQTSASAIGVDARRVEVSLDELLERLLVLVVELAVLDRTPAPVGQLVEADVLDWADRFDESVVDQMSHPLTHILTRDISSLGNISNYVSPLFECLQNVEIDRSQDHRGLLHHLIGGIFNLCAIRYKRHGVKHIGSIDVVSFNTIKYITMEAYIHANGSRVVVSSPARNGDRAETTAATLGRSEPTMNDTNQGCKKPHDGVEEQDTEQQQIRDLWIGAELYRRVNRVAGELSLERGEAVGWDEVINLALDALEEQRDEAADGIEPFAWGADCCDNPRPRRVGAVDAQGSAIVERRCANCQSILGGVSA